MKPVTVPDLMLVRTLPLAPALRAAPAAADEPAAPDETPEADVLGSVFGHFSVFNSWYPIASWWEGDFLEQIAPGSFAKTIDERGSQVVSAFDHGFDPTIGDKVLGPFTNLGEDSVGGAYEFDLLDTSYNRDLMPALKRGLYGSSFRFQVIKDSWDLEPEVSAYNPTGVPERTIREVRLFELGPVTYPANPAATANMRGLVCGTDRYMEALRHRDPSGVDQMRGRLDELRTAAGLSAADRTDTPAAAAPTDEPAASHSGGMTHAQRRARLYPYLEGASR